MAKDLAKLELHEDLANIVSNIDLKTLNKDLSTNQTISKSVIAGPQWSKHVPPTFTMENFKVFDVMDIPGIEEFMEVDLDPLKGALDAAVHLLKFEGQWKTVFNQVQNVKFSDGNTYEFMKAKIRNVPWYDSNSVQMVTLPFSGEGDIVIDFIQPKGKRSDFLDLAKHPTWVAESKVVAEKSYVIIPKVKFDYSKTLDLSPEPDITSMQKVKINWDKNGVKAEAVTFVMSRSFQFTPTFSIHRPFYFVIRKGSIWLFAGYISQIDKKLNASPKIKNQNNKNKNVESHEKKNFNHKNG